MRERPMIANIGRKANQAGLGMCCKARHVVHLVSASPELPSICPITFGNSAREAMAIPTRLSKLAPARRSCPGILCHAAAAQSANALHILIE